MISTDSTSPEFQTSQIQVLSGRELVRKRPGMFVGDDRDGEAITHMLLEVISNSLDQFLAGLATHIDVQIEADGSCTVTDDGVGIAVREQNGKSYLELVLTELHCGPTADGHAPHEHLGLRGIGLAPVNFLSAYCNVSTHRDGRAFRMQFREGVKHSALVDLGESTERGTQVRFLADASILDCSWIDVGAISRRLYELSWLNPGLRISFSDQRKQVYFQPDGLLAYFHQRFPELEAAPFCMQACQDDIEVRACAGIPKRRWDFGIKSYVNTEETTEHGVHVDGFLMGFADALLAPKAAGRAFQEKLRQRIAAVIVVRLNDPRYGAPTKARLLNPRVKDIVRALTFSAAKDFLREHPGFMNFIS